VLNSFSAKLHANSGSPHDFAAWGILSDVTPPPEKMSTLGKVEFDFRTGSLAILRPPRPIRGDCQETDRFPGELAPRATPRQLDHFGFHRNEKTG
jgi:hypothetical protein